MKAATLTGQPTRVCGHRGAAADAPENTMAAFRLAADAGAEWVEFDVQLTRDDVAVVMHDDDVARTTDGAGIVVEMTHAQVAALNAAAKFDAPDATLNFVREPVPDLAAVLSGIGAGRGLGLNIELKAQPGVTPDLGPVAAALVYSHNLREQVIISSFDHARLQALRDWFAADSAARPAIALGMLYHVSLPDPVGLAQSMGAAALHPKASLVDAALVARAHAAGLAVNVWTVDDPAEMERLLHIGVDMIISNTPGRLRAVRDAAGADGR